MTIWVSIFMVLGLSLTAWRLHRFSVQFRALGKTLERLGMFAHECVDTLRMVHSGNGVVSPATMEHVVAAIDEWEGKVTDEEDAVLS